MPIQSSRITKLQQQKAAIQLLINAEDRKQKLEDRKIQDRRKIITGAIILTYAITTDKTPVIIHDLIRKHVLDKDKNIFPDFFTPEEIETAEANTKMARSNAQKAKQRMDEISNEATTG